MLAVLGVDEAIAFWQTQHYSAIERAPQKGILQSKHVSEKEFQMAQRHRNSKTRCLQNKWGHKRALLKAESSHRSLLRGGLRVANMTATQIMRERVFINRPKSS